MARAKEFHFDRSTGPLTTAGLGRSTSAAPNKAARKGTAANNSILNMTRSVVNARPCSIRHRNPARDSLLRLQAERSAVPKRASPSFLPKMLGRR
jgi:hypothetical protein